MTEIIVSEKDFNIKNLEYALWGIKEIIEKTGGISEISCLGSRSVLRLHVNDYYKDIIKAELSDRIAEIIAIKYKYDFFTKKINVGGLTKKEKEILMASLISADLEEDKKYSFEKVKVLQEIPIDGIYNFRLKPLKKKWEDIVSYIPSCFVNSQLKDFITYLLENKKKRVYIDEGKVYDCHYRRLKRSELLGGGEEVKIIREVLLSDCGEVELTGTLPPDDEFYLKEYYGGKIYFNSSFFN